MKIEIRRPSSEVERLKIFLFCVLISIFCITSCSIPNLEKPECTEARITVKEFYSYHLGNDMKLTKENLQKRERFLTVELKHGLDAQTDSERDYFTATNDYPKAFRAGTCEVVNENKAVFQIVFFWRDDARNEQREVKVETVKQNDKWLIDKVSN